MRALISALSTNMNQQLASSESAPDRNRPLQSTPTSGPKIHAPARPPSLDTSTTYSKFRSWRTIWNDYRMISKLDQLPLHIQKAEFRSCLTEDMPIHIKCAIDIQD